MYIERIPVAQSCTMSTVQVRKKKEAGAYECVAENGNGDPVSATAELTVFEGDFDREEEYGEHDIYETMTLKNWIHLNCMRK